MHYSILFALLLLSHRVLCTPRNITVNDNDSRISYYPPGAWTAGNNSESCVACAKPDPTKMYNGTWHEGIFNPFPNKNGFSDTPLLANLTFNGTAVYVFCALAQSLTQPNGNSNVGFYIDGLLRHTLVDTSPSVNGYQYNVSVFSVDSLMPGQHTLTLQNGNSNALIESVVLLDYIIFSFDPDDTIPPSNSSIGSGAVTEGASLHKKKIITFAVTVPIVAFLLILAFGYLTRWRRRRQTARNFPTLKRLSVTPVPKPMASWIIEPLSLPPAHPASGYLNGSGRQVTASVPSAPTVSSQGPVDVSSHSPSAPKSPRSGGQDFVEMPRRSYRPVSSSASASSYGRVIYVHNLDTS
ncbi:hypothetical protein BDP27DRAFT_1441709 [Rhodocollybia butyracea]|uniref:Uncharacterized protein n=1 Tax=Rhodocollybia butyracea TaxID=206335 RepID=A0A9P5Q9X9_9AGAR|nr:hypothetical protein BDP27DRAFT_1441709 [Rhodocollybia butyracea]